VEAMTVKRVSPDEAHDLVQKEGYVYVDVRSIPEFEAGHPTGAYNVPIAHLGPAGMVPNPEFLSVMQKNFPRDAKIVVGCKSGGRSLQAANVLASAGYANVIDQRAGFQAGMDPAGRMEPGWGPKGLPTSQKAEAGRGYDALRGKE
jgi:rhodanese-related sulfurtransferase